MTIHQYALHERLERMFGRTPEWSALHAARQSCGQLSPEDAYVHLSRLFVAFQGWRFTRLPRTAGLPQTPEERRESFFRALDEERHAREVVPETYEPSLDERPSAVGEMAPYLELNPELEEALEIDYPGLSHRRTARVV